MNNRNHRNEGTEAMRWSSFLSGALVGGGIALLLAPQSGTKLRGIICDYAGRMKEDLLERAEDAYDKGADVIKDAGQSAKEFAQQGQETVQDAGRSAREFAKQTQDVARDRGRSAP
jgi:gas vesicle protein